VQRNDRERNGSNCNRKKNKQAGNMGKHTHKRRLKAYVLKLLQQQMEKTGEKVTAFVTVTAFRKIPGKFQGCANERCAFEFQKSS